MSISTPQSNNLLAPPINSTFLWAIGMSVAVHLTLALVIPNFEFEPRKPADVIEVALEEIKKPEPPPPPPPEPPKPAEPIKPEVKPKPIKQPKPEPLPQVIKPAEDKAPPPPAQTPVQPEVIAVAPRAETPPPAFTAPAPIVEPQPVEVPKQPQFSDEDIDNAKNRYGAALTREIAKHKQYPKIAQTRGWQGEALIALHLDSNGKVVKSEIEKSSGFESLDNQALTMVRKSSFPAPPEALKGRSFEITVPVTFKLE